MTPRSVPDRPARPNPVLERALAYARHGWPVFPCQPGRKIPSTAHGHLEATTDPGQITEWFTARPDWNLAVATGLPGPDVLDVDKRATGTGFAALDQLRQAGLIDGAAAWVRTPSGGVHGYFAGSAQRNGHLADHHLDFRSAGGYVLVPPSRVAGRRYKLIAAPAGRAGLDWSAVTTLLDPARQGTRVPGPSGQPGRAACAADVERLAAWVADLKEGNRNAGLFWATNRALEAGHDQNLDALADAAIRTGLGRREIDATLTSARRTTKPNAPRSDRQAEAAT